MTSAIVDGALLLTRLLHESGHDREAVDVAIEPFSETFQQQAVAATEAVACSEAARRFRQRLSAEMVRLDPELT